MKARFAITLLATAALGVLAVQAPAMAEVRLGLAAPLTGPNAATGEQYRRGAEAAVKALNAAGGVNGQQVTLVYGDDASDPRQGVAAANELVGEGVAAVIGHYNSSVSIPASTVYAEEGVLQITPGSTNPQLTEQGIKTVFRTCGRDDQQGDVAGTFLATAHKGRKVAILHDQTTYGKGVADATKARMNSLGLKEVMYEGITVGERDFSAIVSKMKAANVDAVFFGGLYNEGGLILRQMRDQGLKAQFLSPDGTVSQEFWGITGPSGEGALVTFGPEMRDQPKARDAVAQFRAAGYEPEGYTLYTYAAVQVWAEAAKKAGSVDGAKVAAALHDGSAYDTVIGPLTFDAKGDPAGSNYVLYRWEDGKMVQLTDAQVAKLGQ
ncbi:branched-chain amino acid ABC transporter substrate-binding protein [Mycobacterium sp. KBS0706]|uniref:branched-chain amino acid ABC transporter substrate-binding protein n=1 Tax=Mycobacterium sp. KBS0706 TaxID=2578109 RepID=UPI001C8F3CF3|nr:branched-chain amino acid ABC transporter substrate-binding protein [Mycobacterium sp. KBS0706]